MPTQTVVDAELYNKHMLYMANVEASEGEIVNSTSEYWYNLYLIHRDKTWKAVTDDGKITTFLRDLSYAPYGCSIQSFYNRMSAIQKWKCLGLTDDKIKLLLGSRTEMALQHDIEAWFSENGELKPEVAAQIEAGNETPSEYLERVSQLSPTEARQETQRLTVKDKIFLIPDDCNYDVNTGQMLCVARWDNEEDGMMWLGSIRINAVQTAPENTGKVYMPEMVAKFIAKKLGLRL